MCGVCGRTTEPQLARDRKNLKLRRAGKKGELRLESTGRHRRPPPVPLTHRSLQRTRGNMSSCLPVSFWKISLLAFVGLDVLSTILVLVSNDLARLVCKNFSITFSTLFHLFTGLSITLYGTTLRLFRTHVFNIERYIIISFYPAEGNCRNKMFLVPVIRRSLRPSARPACARESMLPTQLLGEGLCRQRCPHGMLPSLTNLPNST